MIPNYKTFFFTFSIVRCDGDKDFPSVLPSNSKSSLDTPVSDSSVVVIDSDILYGGGALALLATAVTLRFLFYLILCNRYYSIFYS